MRGVWAPVFALMGYAAASLGIPRGVACRCVVWLGVQIYRRGMPGFFNGNGGMRGAAARRLLMDQVDQMDLMDKIGAPCDTPWVCGAAVRFGLGKMCRRGDYCPAPR